MAKILATRFEVMIDKFIPSNQSTFFKEEGMLVERVVVVNEVLDLAKKSKKACLIFKVDFEKVYDSISYNLWYLGLMRSGG